MSKVRLKEFLKALFMGNAWNSLRLMFYSSSITLMVWGQCHFYFVISFCRLSDYRQACRLLYVIPSRFLCNQNFHSVSLGLGPMWKLRIFVSFQELCYPRHFQKKSPCPEFHEFTSLENKGHVYRNRLSWGKLEKPRTVLSFHASGNRSIFQSKIKGHTRIHAKPCRRSGPLVTFCAPF